MTFAVLLHMLRAVYLYPCHHQRATRRLMNMDLSGF